MRRNKNILNKELKNLCVSDEDIAGQLVDNGIPDTIKNIDKAKTFLLEHGFIEDMEYYLETELWTKMEEIADQENFNEK